MINKTSEQVPLGQILSIPQEVIAEREYFPTKGEWKADKEQVFAYHDTAGALVYTVPVGKILYITSAFVSCVGVSSEKQALYKYYPTVVLIACNGSNSNALSFPMPLKILSGIPIYQEKNGYCGFHGYLEVQT